MASLAAVRSNHGGHSWYSSETTVPANDNELSGDAYRTSFDGITPLKVGDYFDAKRYLFPCPQSDSLIRKKASGETQSVGADEYLKGKTYVVICCFYVPLMRGHNNVASTCRDIINIFTELAREHHDDFGVVLVMCIRSDYCDCSDPQVGRQVFNNFFSAFPSLFAAVPIWDWQRSCDLFKLTGTSSYVSPDCVVADLVNHKVSHTGFYDFESHGADFYPFTRDKLWELKEQLDAMRSGKIPLSTFLRHQNSDVLHCEAHLAEFTSSCGKRESLSGLANKLVWLYYLCDGSFMDQLLDLYNKCKAEEKSDFEIVVVPTKEYLMSGEERVRVDSLLQHPDCCGWLHLPFDDRVSRRMHNLCDYSCQDKLVVVGPNTSYVDPDGKEVFLECKIDAYPFTKQTVCDNEVERLRNVTLVHWLNSCDIPSLMKSKGEIFPVTKLEGANVLVIFCITHDSKFCLDWHGGNVVEWVNEMKTASKARFEVIFLCSSLLNEDGIKEMNELCTNNGWLRPVTYDYDRNIALHNLLFGRLLHKRHGLLAFGPKGNLLRLCLHYDLQRDSGPATFPDSDNEDSLATDVGVHLNSRFSSDIWRGALNVPGWRGYLM